MEDPPETKHVLSQPCSEELRIPQVPKRNSPPMPRSQRKDDSLSDLGTWKAQVLKLFSSNSVSARKSKDQPIAGFGHPTSQGSQLPLTTECHSP